MYLFFIKQCHSEHLLRQISVRQFSSNCYGTDNTNIVGRPYLLENVGLEGGGEGGLKCPNHGQGKDDRFGTFGLHFENFGNEREVLFPAIH